MNEFSSHPEVSHQNPVKAGGEQFFQNTTAPPRIDQVSTRDPWMPGTKARRSSPVPANPSHRRSKQPVPAVRPEYLRTKAARSHSPGAMPASTRLRSQENEGGSCRHPESGPASSPAGYPSYPQGRWPDARSNCPSTPLQPQVPSSSGSGHTNTGGLHAL